jgi:V/A-type H+-transporting ATPase subunit C
MRSLARYAATNALTRTMLSELLSGGEFESMIRSESLPGAWLALRKTSYGAWLPEEPPGDILAIEKAFRETTAKRFRRSIHALRGAPREVGLLLLSRWDLDNLEFSLRLWHGKDKKLQRFLTFPSFVDEVPVYDIVEAETLEEIGLLLRTTPYVEPVTASLAAYRERKSVFYVELALERDYYRRLLAASGALGGADANLARRIVGAEIDLVNLAWLSRLVDYYKIGTGDLHTFVIPGPSTISKHLAERGLSPDRLKELRSEALAGRVTKDVEARFEAGSVSMLETLVGETVVETARNTLSGYPFSIGCVFAFYLLKRTELRNLNTVFAGKWLGTEESEITKRLYGLR